MFGNKKLWWGLIVFLLAVAVRGIYLWESSDNPTFNAPIIDSQTYDRLACHLSEDKKITYEFFWQQFFYPFFLSVVYFFTHQSILLAKIFQITLSSFTCLLIYRLGKNIFGTAAGLCAALIATIYGPSIFFDCELLDNVWSSFWAVLLIILLLKVAAKQNLIFCIVLGICSALSILTRPNFIPFLAVAFIWLIIVWRREKMAIKQFTLTLFGFFLITVPVAFLNYKTTNNLSILPNTGWVNLYIGNNPDFQAVSIRPGYKWEETISLPARAGIYEPDKVQKFFADKTIEYFHTQPSNFLKGLFRKTLEFTSTRELPGNIDIYLYRNWSKLLAVSVWKINGFGFPFGLLLPLSILGIIFYRRSIPAPLYLFILLYPLAAIATHIEARYRTPIIGPMCILAGAALTRIAQLLTTGRYFKISVIVLAGIAISFIFSIVGPFYSEQTENINYEAEMYFSTGCFYSQQGQFSLAEKDYLRAIEIKNDFPEPHHNLGLLLAKQGKFQQAMEHYNIAIKINSDGPDLLHNMGDSLFASGQTEEAIKYFCKALEFDARRVKTMINLANAYLKNKQPSEALKYYSKAIEIDPENSTANNNLGNYCAMQREYDKAIKHYTIALKTDSHNPGTLCNFANVLMQTKQYQQAIEKYRESLQIDPNNAIVHYYLGICLEKTGQTDEAIKEYSKSTEIDPNNKAASNALNRLLIQH